MWGLVFPCDMDVRLMMPFEIDGVCRQDVTYLRRLAGT